MFIHLKVYTDIHNIARAEVPASCMWELVEYLSFQRTAVAYEYRASHFVVSFLHRNAESAQQILDEWTRSVSGALEAVA